MSITRTALAHGSGRIVLFYANRDETSVIFARELAALAAEHPDRLVVVHWLESVQGLPTQEQMKAFTEPFTTYDAFVCGPAPFMKLTIAALRELEFPRERRHQEKFISLGGNPFGDPRGAGEGRARARGGRLGRGVHRGRCLEPEQHESAEGGPEGNVRLEVELDGETYAFDDWAPTTKMLEHLESKGVKAPYSCREGECSACAVRLLEGEVKMLHNDVLDDEDLAEGIRLGLPVAAGDRRGASDVPLTARERRPAPFPPRTTDHRQPGDDGAHDRVDQVVLARVDQRQRHGDRVEQQQRTARRRAAARSRRTRPGTRSRRAGTASPRSCWAGRRRRWWCARCRARGSRGWRSGPAAAGSRRGRPSTAAPSGRRCSRPARGS